MEYNYYKIGEIIRRERKNKKWSQEDLLNQLSSKEVKIHRNTLSDIENGCKKGVFSLPLLTALSELFNCEVGYLLGEYECKTGRNTDIKKETGLTDNAINSLSYLNKQDMIVLNALIERGDIILIKYAIKNYFRQFYNSITINGFGESKCIDGKEKDKVFKYICNSFVDDIFNSLIHDKEITNTFMQDATTTYYESLENCIAENNNLYEQTETRKEFINKVKKTIQKNIDKNNDFDYYSFFDKITKDK